MMGRGLGLVTAEDEEWIVNQLLFANDTAVVADTEKLTGLVKEYEWMCKRRKLKERLGNEVYQGIRWLDECKDEWLGAGESRLFQIS